MTHPLRYLVPARLHRVEELVKRSRFITSVGRASTVEEAAAFTREVELEFPDATHHCWAYLVGPPGTTARVGMSDAGEPHGTAGRPILSALVHAGVGDIVAVVTRYYGGTKLGTGGLVRAYGGGVQRALATLPRTERVELVTVDLLLDYASLPAVESLLAECHAEVLGREYGARVQYRLRLPADETEHFRSAVLDATRGQASFS